MSAAVIFDLDGTLIDSAPDIHMIANEALKIVQAPPITLAQTHDFIGEGIYKFVERMRDARDLPQAFQDALVDDMSKRYNDAVYLTHPYDGVVDALSELSKQYRLGVCTNKLTSATEAILKHLNLFDNFDLICGGDNPLGYKPNPAALLHMFDKMGCDKQLFVGDSEVDSQTAIAAGVPFFFFTKGYRKKPVDEIEYAIAFDDFKNLPNLIADFILLK